MFMLNEATLNPKPYSIPTVSGPSIPRMSVILVHYRQLEVPGRGAPASGYCWGLKN